MSVLRFPRPYLKEPTELWEIWLDAGIAEVVRDLDVWNRWELLEAGELMMPPPDGWWKRDKYEVPFG